MATTSSYGQFCPVAKAMEILDERWTLLIVRELLLGSSHFNDLRRGVPKMSPALLSKRLKSLHRAGVVERREVAGRTSYSLTQSGQELADVVHALSRWGVRWVGELGEDDLDPHLLMWDMRRTVPIDAWPRARTVVEFRLGGVAPKQSHWWMVVSEGAADVCDFDPGFDVTATVETNLRTLTEVWRGDTSWQRALLEGEIALSGPTDVRRLIPAWFGQGTSAGIARPA